MTQEQIKNLETIVDTYGVEPQVDMVTEEKVKEYVRLHWKHDFDNEPIFIFYEVCIDNERLAKPTKTKRSP